MVAEVFDYEILDNILDFENGAAMILVMLIPCSELYGVAYFGK